MLLVSYTSAPAFKDMRIELAEPVTDSGVDQEPYGMHCMFLQSVNLFTIVNAMYYFTIVEITRL